MRNPEIDAPQAYTFGDPPESGKCPECDSIGDGDRRSMEYACGSNLFETEFEQSWACWRISVISAERDASRVVIMEVVDSAEKHGTDIPNMPLSCDKGIFIEHYTWLNIIKLPAVKAAMEAK